MLLQQTEGNTQEQAERLSESTSPETLSGVVEIDPAQAENLDDLLTGLKVRSNVHHFFAILSPVLFGVFALYVVVALVIWGTSWAFTDHQPVVHFDFNPLSWQVFGSGD